MTFDCLVDVGSFFGINEINKFSHISRILNAAFQYNPLIGKRRLATCMLSLLFEIFELSTSNLHPYRIPVHCAYGRGCQTVFCLAYRRIGEENQNILMLCYINKAKGAFHRKYECHIYWHFLTPIFYRRFKV